MRTNRFVENIFSNTERLVSYNPNTVRVLSLKLKLHMKFFQNKICRYSFLINISQHHRVSFETQAERLFWEKAISISQPLRLLHQCARNNREKQMYLWCHALTMKIHRWFKTLSKWWLKTVTCGDSALNCCFFNLCKITANEKGAKFKKIYYTGGMNSKELDHAKYKTKGINAERLVKSWVLFSLI